MLNLRQRADESYSPSAQGGRVQVGFARRMPEGFGTSVRQNRNLPSSRRPCLWNPTTGELAATLVALRDGGYLALSPDGHYRGSPNVEQELVYVVETDAGEQILLTPGELAKKYS